MPMDTVLYHNPDCSKSRAALEWLQQQNKPLHIIDYIATPPTLTQLHQLSDKLNADSPLLFMRNDNELFRQLGLDGADNQTLFAALAAHPELLQRPILIIGDRAVIGRPLENLQNFYRQAA